MRLTHESYENEKIVFLQVIVRRSIPRYSYNLYQMSQKYIADKPVRLCEQFFMSFHKTLLLKFYSLLRFFSMIRWNSDSLLLLEMNRPKRRMILFIAKS